MVIALNANFARLCITNHNNMNVQVQFTVALRPVLTASKYLTIVDEMMKVNVFSHQDRY